jgi:hypothetical protein
MVDVDFLQERVRDSILNNITINLSNVREGVSLVLSLEKESLPFKIIFNNVEYYNIDYDKERGYQYITNLKIFKTDSLYYISLDPYSEEKKIDIRDANCIIAEQINIVESAKIL